MKLTTQTCCAVLGVLAWTAFSAPATAHNPVGAEKAGALESLASQSNLVLRGRVAKVEYKMSEPNEGEGSLPQTIVTYQVGDVLRGKAPGETFTMRFIGGPDGMGRFLSVSGVPKFEEGDQDLLFIAGNGEKGCPLVLCEYGRFRILRSGVYNAKGSPVRAVRQDQALARGPAPKEFMTFHYPAPKFDDLVRNPEVQAILKEQNLSMEEARARYEQEAPKQIEMRANVSQVSNAKDLGKDIRVRPNLQPRLQKTPIKPMQPRINEPQLKLDKRAAVIAKPGAQIAAIPTTPEDLPDGPMAVEEFMSHVKRVVEKVDRQPTALRSFDPNAPIRIVAPRQTTPQKVEMKQLGAQEMTPEDKAEYEALQEQDFDPVIKRR